MVNVSDCEHFGGNLFIFYKYEAPLNLYTWYWWGGDPQDSVPGSITITQLPSISVTAANYTVWNF